MSSREIGLAYPIEDDEVLSRVRAAARASKDEGKRQLIALLQHRQLYPWSPLSPPALYENVSWQEDGARIVSVGVADDSDGSRGLRNETSTGFAARIAFANVVRLHCSWRLCKGNLAQCGCGAR